MGRDCICFQADQRGLDGDCVREDTFERGRRDELVSLTWDVSNCKPQNHTGVHCAESILERVLYITLRSCRESTSYRMKKKGSELEIFL